MDTWVQGPATQCLHKLNICVPQPSLAAELCRLLPALPAGQVRRRKTSGAKQAPQHLEIQCQPIASPPGPYFF